MSFDPSHDLASGDARAALERRARTETVYSPLVILLTALAAVGIVLYSWFLLDPGNRGDLLPWSMVIVAETVLISQALISMWTILAGAASPRDYAFHAARERACSARCPRGGDATNRPIRVNGEEVLVDVFITVYGEPLATIRRTATAALRDDAASTVPGSSTTAGRTRCGSSRPSWAATTSAGCRATAPRRATSTTRCPSPRATTSPSSTPTSCRKQDFLLETVPFFVEQRRRLRADAADLRQPAHRSSPAERATCRPCSTGSSSRAATTSTRPSASAPTWCSAGRRSTTSVACTPTRSPRTCGPR